MSSYVRKTERRSTPLTMSRAGDSQSLADYNQLMEIENAIEDMEKMFWEKYTEFLNKISDIEQRLANLEMRG